MADETGRIPLSDETARVLLDLSRELSEVGTPTEIGTRLAAAVLEVLPVDASAVLLVDRDAEMLEVVGLAGWPDELAAQVADFLLPLDTAPIVRQAVDSLEPLRVTVEEDDPLIVTVLETFDTDAALVVPLVARDEGIGLVAGVQRGGTAEPLAPPLVARLQGLAEIAARALDNARLYDEIESHQNILTHLLESGPVVTFRATTRRWRVTYVSQNIRRVFGHDPELFLAESWLDYLHPEDRDEALEQIKRVRDEPDVEFSVRFRDADDRWRHIRVSLRVDLDQSADDREILGYVWDESEQKEAEERYRLVSDLTSDLAFSLSASDDGGVRVEWYTEGVEKLTGYRGDEARELGGFRGMLVPEDEPRWDERMPRLLRGEEVVDTYRIRSRSGEVRWIELIARPVERNHDGSTLIVGAARDLTEQKRVEEALAASEALLREAQAVAHFGSWRVDLETGATEWSGEMYEIYGLEPDGGTMTVDRAIEQVHPADVDLVRQAVRQQVETGELAEYEFRIIRTDGEVRWLHLRAKAEVDDAGEVVGYTGVSQDVTERRRAEEFNRVISEAVSDVAFSYTVCDGDLSLDWVTGAYERVTGRPAEPDEKGEIWTPIAYPDDLPRVREAERRVAEGIATVDEFRILTPTGQPRWMRIYAIPVRDDATGEVVSVHGAAQDVTDQKQAEEALAESEAQLRQIVSESPSAIVSATTEGVVIEWNPAAEEIFGWTRDEVMGQAIPTVPEGDFEAVRDHFSDRLRSGESVRNATARAKRKDGTVIDIEFSMAPLTGPDGELGAVIAVVEDVSERLRLEEDLRQAQKMNAIGRLAGGVAHDFNNVLTAILGHVEFLLEDPADVGEVRDGAVAIRDAADRAASLTEQLLMFSRHRSPAPEVFDLNEVVASMHSMLERLIGEHIEFTVDSGVRPAPVSGSRSQLEQVILNLVVNAGEAMKDGGSLSVETFASTIGDDHAIGLRVSDTGRGIPADVRERIFEPFFSTSESGVGLGLSVVYGIVDNAGGEIAVDSTPGRGTTFEIRLPRATGLVAVASEGDSAPRAVGAARILLVEDEPEVRRVARTALARVGYDVEEAADALEALTRFEDDADFDLLVADLVMPGMSGDELAGRLRERLPALRVLFVSGYSEADGDADADQFPFLQKPFKPQELVAAVRRVLTEVSAADAVH